MRFIFFDENVREHYLSETCNTFDAIYEDLPVMDSLHWYPAEEKACGWMIDTEGAPFLAEKDENGNLCVSWKDRFVIFEKDRIRIRAKRLCFHKGECRPNIAVSERRLDFHYKDTEYAVGLGKRKLQTIGGWSGYHYGYPRRRHSLFYQKNPLTKGVFLCTIIVSYLTNNSRKDDCLCQRNIALRRIPSRGFSSMRYQSSFTIA